LLEGIRSKFLLSLLFASLVIVGLMVYGDFPRMVEALARFYWGYIPAILGLTFLNYLLRFIKWDFYLRQIGVTGLSKRDSFLLFFSGLSMVVTPGKLGEWLKCYLLREMSGTPFSRSAPIVIAERLTDGVAMVLLASGGLFLFGAGWQVLGAALALAVATVALSRNRPLARLLSLAERAPLLSSHIHHLHEFYESAHTLFSPRNLALAISLGFVSWLGEGVAFYLVALGLSQEGSLVLAVQAVFILSAATLAGSLVLLPGGIGVAEGGITGLSQVMLGLSKDAAVAGALIIRFCTLWFGVSLGMVTLFFTIRKLRQGIRPPLAQVSALGQVAVDGGDDAGR